MRINLTDPRLSPTASCLSKRGRRPKPTPLGEVASYVWTPQVDSGAKGSRPRIVTLRRFHSRHPEAPQKPYLAAPCCSRSEAIPALEEITDENSRFDIGVRPCRRIQRPGFRRRTKDASRVYEGRHALGCLCKEVHQGHVMQRGRRLRSAPR